MLEREREREGGEREEQPEKGRIRERQGVTEVESEGRRVWLRSRVPVPSPCLLC